MSTAKAPLETKIQQSGESLDAWVHEVIQWHFDPATGCPFWLNYAEGLGWDPRKEVQSYDDLSRLGPFQDEWLRGGPVRRWVPKGYAGRPVYTFETGGSTGGPISPGHLLHDRPRSALGNQATEDGPAKNGGTIQAACDRTRSDTPARP